MAKAFDLVHKVSKSEDPEQRIPFEDDQAEQPTKPAKKRPRIEVAFFYILLFAVFFIMGMTFLSPGILGSLKKKTDQPAATQISPSPDQGFTIDKDGQSADEAAKALGISATPTPAPTTSATPAPAQSSPTTSRAAKIQILNGTTREGAAASLRTKLANSGIVVSTIGNYHKRTVQRTTIFYKPDYKTAAEQVSQVIGGGILSPSSSASGSNDILIVIGLRN